MKIGQSIIEISSIKRDLNQIHIDVCIDVKYIDCRLMYVTLKKIDVTMAIIMLPITDLIYDLLWY